MPSVSFACEQTEYSISNQPETINWFVSVCKSEQKSLSELTYIFCSDDYLLELNQKHLSHDYYTDVITFDYSEESIVSGDVFISIDRVKDNAATVGVPLREELDRVMIHGLLHLLGYKDKSVQEKEQMTLKEDFYLSSRVY